MNFRRELCDSWTFNRLTFITIECTWKYSQNVNLWWKKLNPVTVPLEWCTPLLSFKSIMSRYVRLYLLEKGHITAHTQDILEWVPTIHPEGRNQWSPIQGVSYWPEDQSWECLAFQITYDPRRANFLSFLRTWETILFFMIQHFCYQWTL